MRKNLVSFVLVALVVAVTISPASAHCGGCGSGSSPQKAGDKGRATILETAEIAGSFETLVAAITAAGLTETLSGPGPFTVFAPTDEAFARLPKGTVETLLKDPEKLAGILTYHVVPGTFGSARVANLQSAKTVNGAEILITTSRQSVKVDDATVTKTDILCSNGVIHVIDAVIVPRDIVSVAISKGSFNTLLTAAEAAGLLETLSGPGPLTVFAPTDGAFARLPQGTVETLLNDRKKLSKVLAYHVVPGKILSSEVMNLTSAVTVQGQKLKIDTKSGVKVNNARVIAADVVAGNGVIHVIDEVLLPE